MQRNEYEAIVNRVLTGDTSAYDRLIEELTAKMIRYARSITKDEHTAEEAVEDAFVECFLHLSSLVDRGSFDGWLAVSVKRKCFRYMSQGSAEDLSEYVEILSDKETPDDFMIRSEDENTIRSAINDLPPAQRETTKLFYLDGCSVKETASALGVPESTVKRRLYDARTKLQKELIGFMEKKTSTIENEIKNKIQKIKKYYALYGEDDTYDKSVDELTPLIADVEDENLRKYYKAEQLRLYSGKDRQKRKERQEEFDRIAEAGEHPMAVARKFIRDSYDKFDMGDDLPKKRAEYLEKTALPALKKCKDLPGYEEAYGILLTYISKNINKYDLDKSVRLLEQALDCFGEDDYYKSAVRTALQTYKESCKRSALPDMGMEDATCRLGVSSKGIRMSRSWHNIILNLPIVQKTYSYPFFFFPFDLADSEQMILYTDKKPGDVVETSLDCSEDGNGEWIVSHVTKYLSDSESVTVPAGTFEHCTHIKKNISRWYTGPEEVDAWFCKGVGLVRYSVLHKGRTEVYELTEYDLRGGEGLLPLCAGNRWVYREKDVPKALESWHEYRVSHVTGDGELYDLSHIGLTYIPKAEDRGTNVPDSEVCLAIVDKLCRKWKLDEALSYLRAAIRANTNEKAVATAICGAHILEKYAGYQKSGYRFLPGGIRSKNVAVNEHTVKETTGTEYDFGPYRYGWRGKYEDRIFGVKPFRYLDLFTDCYWNDEWKPGYKAEIPYKDYEDNETTVYMTVEDGGTVTLPCGTFENCLKVTFEAEMPGEHPEYYYLNWNDGYEFHWCGKKEYWFAPGVGIVRHVCTWGNHISSEMILNSYDVPGSDGKEYLPVHIGTKWEYIETHLTGEGYRAAFCVSVPTGFDGKYQWVCSQEFVYLDTEENYKNRFFGK